MQLKPITALIVLLLVVVSLSMAGCTSSTTNTNPANVNVTAKAVQSPQQFSNVVTPSPGNKYVMYNLTFTNINAPNTQVDGYFSFALLDANNNVYPTHQLIQSRYLSNAFPYGSTKTQPGDKVSGNMVFEVPQNATLVKLRYHDNSGFNVAVPL
jgi:uncharacterized protein YceK